ncbi:hypothetical protein FRC14_005186 [Serendipita sp. 396]|nr:hypothetical protein FRC14_005186 [Serendipita sp. 396]KAG8779993.1 hypothetical protein FRC15_009808 [Serendipita sp. 397]KAG8816577.1 hypothetical protein FRC19_011942 [Serendipita sp. 401]
MSSSQWPISEELYLTSHSNGLQALSRRKEVPLPRPHLQTAFPQRPAVNRSCHWFVAQCFLHLEWQDGELLRNVLRSVFESGWWAANIAPMEAVKNLQLFVRNRTCLFCNHPHPSTSAAMSCVHQHINFSPS